MIDKREKMDIKFVFTDSGDWLWVYVNGGLEYEGHSISEQHLLEILKIPYQSGETDVEAMPTEVTQELFEQSVHKVYRYGG
jgi:hypothetical protein